jgi:hypothetical protein
MNDITNHPTYLVKIDNPKSTQLMIAQEILVEFFHEHNLSLLDYNFIVKCLN